MGGGQAGGEHEDSADAASLMLPPETRSVAAARRSARDVLRSWEAEDLEWTVAQLVTELATNAVLHAGTPFRVTFRRIGDRIRCEVSDGSTEPPRICHYSVEASTGRGLRLVDQLATTWGVTAGDGGKTVWFELDLDPGTLAEPDLDVLLDTFDPPAGSRAARSGCGAQLKAA